MQVLVVKNSIVASSVLIPEMKLKMYMMMEVHKINLKNGKRKLVYSINNKRGLRERMGRKNGRSADVQD